MDFSFYQKINQSNKEALHTLRIESIQDRANSLCDDGIVTGFEVKMGTFLKDKALLNFEKEIDCIIEFERMKEKIYNSNSRSLKCYPNTIKTGDYITHIVRHNDRIPEPRTYIIRSMVDQKWGYDHTFMIICQQILKMLDRDNNVIEFPVNFNDNRTQLSESFEKSALVDDAGTYEIYIQDNEHTRRIAQSDEFTRGQVNRMIFKGRAYKVIGVDDVSMNGLMCVKLKIDKVSPMDNMELGIADYYRYIEDESEKVDTPIGNFVISGEKEILLGDGDYVYSIDSDELNGAEVIWSINAIKGVKLIIDTNDSVRIRVDDNIALKGKIIELKATIYNVDYTKSIKIVNW